jgi:hypothetical protein
MNRLAALIGGIVVAVLASIAGIPTGKGENWVEMVSFD